MKVAKGIMDNEIIKLYDHNKKSYVRGSEAYDKIEKVVGIVYATETVKTYNALKQKMEELIMKKE